MSNSVPNSIIVYYQIAPKRIHPSTVHNIIYIYINIGYKDMTNRTRRRNCQECEAVKRQYHFVSRTLQTGQPVWSPISNHSVEMLYWQKNTKPGWDAGHLPMLGTKPHRFTTEIPWAPWGSELVLGQELIHPVKGPLIRQTHRQKDLSIDAGWLHWWIWVYQYWDDLGSYQNEYQHVKHVDTYWLIGSL